MDRPIISITFDDVPRTAMTNGIPILNRFYTKATFYVAMGLSASSTEDAHKEKGEEETFLTSTDIINLSRCGHDIGCHTYSHYMLDRGLADSLALDAQRNVRELCGLLNASSIDHFSYPFGQVNFTAKKLLAKRYRTMRSSRPGINQRSTDMYLLRANSVYDSTFNKEKLRQVIEEAERSRGWLIFYTHGVMHNPDAYSCTPEQLEWLIKQCKLSSARILTVSEAYMHIVSNR
jgi:peptidoglycan/xylan/chitin deacetylase (PgdA/CDA1 family)